MLFQQKEKMRQGNQVEAISGDKSAISFMFKFNVP